MKTASLSFSSPLISKKGAWAGPVLGLLFTSTAAMAAPVSFTKDIAPVLADKCLTCHQQNKAKGKYRVDTFEQLQRRGDSGDAPLVGGKPDASLLYQRLTSKDEDERMPQKDDPLPAATVALFQRWIAEGAKCDGADPKASLTDILANQTQPTAPAKYPQPLPVTALALSADGARSFTSGYREVLEWDNAKAALLHRFGGMPERVLALDVDLTKPWLLVAGGSPGRSGAALLLDRESGKVLRTLFRGKDTALAARFSPDGSLVAVGGVDNIVRLFRVADFKQVWKAETHADWVTGLAFSPDGQRLASVSRDRTVRVFNSSDGRIEKTFEGHQAAITSVAFDAEGAWLYTGSVDGELRRWLTLDPPENPPAPADKDKDKVADNKKPTDKPAKKKASTAELLKGRHQEISSLCVAGDQLIAAYADGKLRAYELTAPSKFSELLTLGSRVETMRWDAGAKVLYCACHNGEVRTVRATENAANLQFVAQP